MACPYKTTVQDQLDYMKAILPLLEASGHVEAYAWFIARWKTDDWFLNYNCSLLEQGRSALTPVGEYYLNFTYP